MEFVSVHNFVNYMDAHMIMGRLEGEGFNCWLQDENTGTLASIWTNAVGGIKLMVPIVQMERAKEILQQWEEERKKKYSCPNCGSHEVELVTTPGAIGTFLLASNAVAPEQVYHCFQCEAEFDEPIESE